MGEDVEAIKRKLFGFSLVYTLEIVVSALSLIIFLSPLWMCLRLMI